MFVASLAGQPAASPLTLLSREGRRALPVAVVGGRETHTLPRFLGENASPLFSVFAARIVLTVAPCIALVVLLRTRILALR